MSDFYSGVTATALIPGNGDELRALAQRLSTLAAGLGDAVGELRKIDANGWQGVAANAFRGSIQQQPTRYETALDSFSIAASAIRTYASALDNAQHSAQSAITTYQRAQSATYAWSVAAASPTATAATKASSDPGVSGRAAAENTLHNARAELDAAAAQLRNALSDAATGAPQRHTGFRSLIQELGKIPGVGGVWMGTDAFGHAVAEMTKGFLSGARGIVDGIGGVGHFAIHPSGWVKGAGGAVHDVSVIAHNKMAFGKAITNWNEWGKDPAKAMGELLPGIALAFTTAGIGEAAEAGDAVGDASTGLKVAADSAQVLDSLQQDAAVGGLGAAARDVEEKDGKASNYAEDAGIDKLAGSAGKEEFEPVIELQVAPDLE